MTLSIFKPPRPAPKKPVSAPKQNTLPPKPEQGPKEYRLLNTTEAMWEWWGESVKTTKVMAFDFETTGLDPHSCELVGVSFSAGKDSAVYIPCGHIDAAGELLTNQVPLYEVIKLLQTFCSTSILKIAHNIPFESAWLTKLGIRISEPVADTMAMIYCIWPERVYQKGAGTLKNASKEFLGVQQTTFAEVTGQTEESEEPVDFAAVPLDKAADYGSQDTDYTRQIFYYLWSVLVNHENPKVKDLFKIESVVSCILGHMKYHGWLVDRELLERMKAKAEPRLAELDAQVKELIGDPDFNPGSGQQLAQYLYNEKKLPVLKKTDTGAPSTDAEVLKKLKYMAKLLEWNDDSAHKLLEDFFASGPTDEQIAKANDAYIRRSMFGLRAAVGKLEMFGYHISWDDQFRLAQIKPLLELLEERATYQKIVSTYLEGYGQHIHPATGKIHTDLRQFGIRSGRFSSRAPNLQNSPRSDNDIKIIQDENGKYMGIRSLFVASPGNTMVFADYAGFEIRITAWKSRDPYLLNAYRTEVDPDIHSRTTAGIFGGLPSDYKKPEKKWMRSAVGKPAMFLLIYGGGGYTLANNIFKESELVFTADEAQGFLDRTLDTYGGIKSYQQEMVSFAQKHGYVETLGGFRRHLPDIQFNWPRGLFGKDKLRAQYGSMDLVPEEVMERYKAACKGMRDKDGASRQAMNTPIQGTAADIMKLAMVRIWNRLDEFPGAKIIMQIHDELIIECPDSMAVAVGRMMKEEMEREVPGFDVPLVADLSAGKRWSEKKGLAV